MRISTTFVLSAIAWVCMAQTSSSELEKWVRQPEYETPSTATSKDPQKMKMLQTSLHKAQSQKNSGIAMIALGVVGAAAAHLIDPFPEKNRDIASYASIGLSFIGLIRYGSGSRKHKKALDQILFTP